METTTNRIAQARTIFKRHGGTMRTAEAMKAGIHPEVIYKMRDEGLLEPLARGLYRLIGTPEPGFPDLVAVALKIPKGVICMISALSFHEMTTQLPHAVDIVLVRGSEPPRLDYPPIHLYWSVAHVFKCGIEKQMVDGITVRIHNPVARSG